MSSRDKDTHGLDHALAQALRRRVAHRAPRPEVRRRLLLRAASRRDRPWLETVIDGIERGPASPDRLLRGLDLGWRELAFAQALRPSGVFGSLAGLLR